MESDSADDSLCILYEKLVPKPDIQIVDVISGLGSKETEPQLQEAFIDICQDSPETAKGASQNIQLDDSICVLQEKNKSQATMLGTKKKFSKEDKTVAAPSGSRKKRKIECGIRFDSLKEMEFHKDTHLCVCCGRTIEGLNNYVFHCQKQCFESFDIQKNQYKIDDDLCSRFEMPVEDSAFVKAFSSYKQSCSAYGWSNSHKRTSAVYFLEQSFLIKQRTAEQKIISANNIKSLAQTFRNMANDYEKAIQKLLSLGSNTLMQKRLEDSLSNMTGLAEHAEELMISRQQSAERAIKDAEESKAGFEFARKLEMGLQK